MVGHVILLGVLEISFGGKVFQINLGEVPVVFVIEDMGGLIECSQYIQIAGGVVACAIDLIFHHLVLIGVALSVAGALLPQNHLIHPIIVSQ